MLHPLATIFKPPQRIAPVKMVAIQDPFNAVPSGERYKNEHKSVE